MASMAATSSLAGTGSALPSPSPVSSRKVFVAFNGLKASPIVVKSLFVKSPSIRSSWRPVNATCATEAETLEQCQKIVAEQLGVEPERVKPESKFSDLGADSLDTVEIVMALEEKFKITVEQEGAEKIVTVKDAADVIHQLVTKKE